MKVIHAIYEKGVFRPVEPIELPEGCEVTIDPQVVTGETPGPGDSTLAHLRPGLARTYAILSESYDSGQTDLAERHNEHQP